MKRLATSLVAGSALLLVALIAPLSVAAAGPVTSSACTSAGTAVTCDLWAKTGTLSLPGSASTTIWGFSATDVGAASVPGPTLIVNSGDTVTVNLVNQLAVTTSILFEGQPVAPDLTGVAPAASKAYTFTAGSPGSYLYEAGLIPGSQYQAAMGLYGALIVRPTGGLLRANNDASTAFADEAIVVLGEVDPALNGSATPASFDLRGYAPRYFLINGKASPVTDRILTASGNTLLVRYLNAGLRHHSMGVLGLRQTVVNEDGNALANPRHMVAESIAPGESTDNLITIPVTTGLSTKYALYDASMILNTTSLSGASAGIGGILTFIDAAGAGSGTDTVGPVTSGLALNTTSGALTATMSDATTGGSGVIAAEYFVDTIGAPGTGLAMSGTPADPANVSASVNIAALASGDHVIFARGKDSLDHWGAPASVVFTIDKMGPATTGVILTPRAVNSTTASRLTATADDRYTGAANIAAAEYFVDPVGTPATGTGTAMTLSTTTAPVSSLSATIAAGLPSGVHTISVHSQDSLGNWGALSSVTLTVDNGGPVTSGLSVNPDPNNGTQGINSTTPAVRVDATFDAGHGIVTTGELFIDTIGLDGNGVPMAPTDGIFDTAHELGYVDIPLFTVNQLAGGDHPIYVHGKDSLGNWGATSTVVLHINKPGPATSSVTLTPQISSTVPVAISATASTVGISTRNVAGGEYFIDTLGLTGTGQPMTVAIPGVTATMNGTIPSVTVAGLSVGNHTIYVRARDSVGNWGTSAATAVLAIERTAPTITGITLTPDTIIKSHVSVGLTVNGAADIGSGVAGAEWWIGSTDITPGTGTAFTLPSTTVPTGSLAVGSYTVRVRIQDNAGNWSAVSTAPLTVTPAPPPPPDTTPPTFTGITLMPASILYPTATIGLTVDGATDASGIAGGEFWIGTTDIPVGTGTAFSLTSATVPTGSLLPGTYTVRVRIRDGAPTPNWSTAVQTATLTVNPPVAIFSDGFESATLPGGWTSRSTTNTTRLNTSTLARQVGARGLRAQGDNTNYVQYDFGTATNPAASIFDARFSFQPNAKTSTGQDIFTTSADTTYGANRVFRVRYRRLGTTPQVQIQIGTANTNTFWKTISGGSAFNKVEVVWQAYNAAIPGSGRLELLVNGFHAQTLVTTSTRSVATFRLGSVSVSGNATYEYFDTFSAKRTATPYLP